MIAGEGLVKRYDGTTALAGVEVEIGAGEVVALLGPNGAGKSTLIRCLHLLTSPDEGTVRLDGEPVTPDDLEARRRMAMVAQDPHLFRGTVADNLKLPLELRGWSRDRIAARVDALTERFGLADLAGRGRSALSGGQMQRLAFARAVAPEPDVLFLDEFASNLDRDRLADVEDAIREVAADGGAVVLVTHDRRQVAELADRVVALENGRVTRRGPTARILDRLPASWRGRPGSPRGRRRAREDRPDRTP